MRTHLFTALMATSILTATPLAAQETITYEYDALGRLVEVVTDGGPADNVTSGYTYDKAGNRTLVAASDSTTPTPIPTPTIGCNITILDSYVDGGVAIGDIVSHTAYLVSATGTCTGAVVTYATQNGTATSPTNYTATSGTLTLTSDPALQGVTVNGIRLTNTIPRTFFSNFSSTTPGVTFTDAQASIVIESGIGGNF